MSYFSRHYLLTSIKKYLFLAGTIILGQLLFQTSAYAANLIANPNFTQGLTSWTPAHGSSYVFTDPTVTTGNVLRVTGATWATVTQDLSSQMKPGSTYTLTFQGRASGSNVNGYAEVQFIDSNWNNISVPMVSINSTSLKSYQLQVTVPTNMKYVHLGASISSQNATTANYADFTNVSVILNTAAACGSTPSGSTTTKTVSTTTGNTTPTVAQCPYGGTQATTSTVTQIELCTNGTLTNQGSPVTTTVNTGNPVCKAPAACGSTPSGSTTVAIVSTTAGSVAATTAQCSYGGTQATATTVTQVELCTNGTLTKQGSPVTVILNNGSPVCKAPAACGATASGSTTTKTVSTTTGSITPTVAQCPYGGTQATTTTLTQTELCTNGTLSNQGSPVTSTVTNGSPVCNASPTASAPSLATAVGYNTNTFSSSSFSATKVDMAATYKSGYQWYLFNFYGSTPTSAHVSFNNSDGSVSVGQGGNSYNANLASAGKISAAPGYVGTAFGGGAYIEAVIKFNAQSYAGIGQGWPSFWANALEGNMQNSQWPGQATGYRHYIEADIFEYFQGQWSDSLNSYQATLEDWYGTNGSLQVSVPAVTTVPQANFSQYNKVAMLWVPATSTTKGYINFYWNGSLVHSQSYTQLTNADQPSITSTTPWAYGIIDQDHLVLEMGSNNTYPIIVQSVNVWQANATKNLHN